MDGLQQEVDGEHADDVIPLDIPCPKCDGELLIDGGLVRCNTCSFQAA